MPNCGNSIANTFVCLYKAVDYSARFKYTIRSSYSVCSVTYCSNIFGYYLRHVGSEVKLQPHGQLHLTTKAAQVGYESIQMATCQGS